MKPILLKGFRDLLPQHAKRREDLINILKNTLESCGFEPIDTPILEYQEAILDEGLGDTSKQVYKFEDNGGRKVALRFDLTMPLARFVSMHKNEIQIPFKRYQFGKVFRGENTQKGRYREFVQFDFDIVGDDSVVSDFQILNIAFLGMKNIGLENFEIRFSSRALLSELLLALKIDQNKNDIYRVIDKIYKMPEDDFKKELEIYAKDKTEVLFLLLKAEKNSDETYLKLKSFLGESSALKRIADILVIAKDFENNNALVLSPAVVRGLGYYTGIAYETFIKDIEDIGSFGSGGRYSNLLSSFDENINLSGVGGSFGIDRILSLEKLNFSMHKNKRSLILNFKESLDLSKAYFKVQKKMVENGDCCEIFLKTQSISKQMKYAYENDFDTVIILGEEELKNSKFKKIRLADKYEEEFTL